ncbi:hypothetical protein GTP44_19445 [Duganella sp. FT50W]|uniref:DUF1837 domain-containing protein n=2 Tax=Duganella TaxID=75654 RepID=A0ABW9WG21_9BURK|nr:MULTISPECIES: hypothetical protein [Duganella]MYM84115.1 hypothetical protein [Duganella lactea]MYN39170.1 hypothetical protein [Duganella margarita]
MKITFSPPQDDAVWGCTYQHVTSSAADKNIKLCFVEVKDLHAFATALVEVVLDNSWITNLDDRYRRAYSKTVSQTAAKLVNTFNKTASGGNVESDFGETMVSMGSSRALEMLFTHLRIPLAELWKPQISQNGGFDFHTTCLEKFINFGEAKYSSSANPYTDAISQAQDFLNDDKHLRDAPDLENLVDKQSMSYLDKDDFGVIAAFSVNAQKPELILANAFLAAQEMMKVKKIKNFYLVGVR